MKHSRSSQDRNQRSYGESQAAVVDLTQVEIGFIPSPDEVAKRAYFSFLNQDLRPGHEVRHWLEAAAQLIEERKITRTHGFYNLK